MNAHLLGKKDAGEINIPVTQEKQQGNDKDFFFLIQLGTEKDKRTYIFFHIGIKPGYLVL